MYICLYILYCSFRIVWPPKLINMTGQFHTTCSLANSLTDMYYRVLGCTLKIILNIALDHEII